MAISADYPRPISVNGFVCRNCDDVSDARKFIDPAAPKGAAAVTSPDDSAVIFGGSLAPPQAVARAIPAPPTRPLLDRYA